MEVSSEIITNKVLVNLGYFIDACGSPQWFKDGYCDDDNNNAQCGWDGGDCCGNNVNTQYCTDCSCLDPNPVICQDFMSEAKCIKKKNKGKCNKPNIKKKCAKTCGHCTWMEIIDITCVPSNEI